MSTIRKVVITKCGGPVTDVKIHTVELPQPTKDEVQIEVLYSGFGGSDINMRLGRYPLQKKAPLTPGYCFTGRVSVNGPGAKRFAPGTLVTAVTVYDSQADRINVPEKYLVPIPESVSYMETCALSVDWLTAYGMVHRAAKVQKGQRVFVHGLSGAIGNAISSLCQLQGATVYGTASQRNHKDLRQAGATPFVYTDKKWMDEMLALGGVHAVFDPLGFESFDESYSILSETESSILVGYATNKGAMDKNSTLSGMEAMAQIARLYAANAKCWSKKSFSFFYINRDQSTYKPELEILVEMLRQGQISVPIKKVWAMDDIRDAHEGWGKVSGVGSLLIQVAKE
ncbi:zinc-binding dehydrogenase domain-containing protein [Sarocladium implicatum]|jgi:NADPH:quinone reductase-like Zn-dependent oxidoreductase|nr:zinc-binding dehydrogenase domain-containing protein [Sarocladium implicatum]